MDELPRWLFDPFVGQLVAVAVGIVVAYSVSRMLQRAVTRYVDDNSARYRARKIV